MALHNGVTWVNAAPGIGGTSPEIELTGLPFVTVAGTTGAAATLTLEINESQTPGTGTWYTFGATASGTAHAQTFTVAARRGRLKISAAVTVDVLFAASD